ncbi:hypothetical protein Esi_0068_0057 [Ectocarpus siliculosus]|uniref:Uncharacterized protein n=1 Tax=Ectocarpus siliculosus TaxID=2880 RepID=D7G5W3_ECTSI|nr:hypothetical protein Esi_0068_0057 [Ectocarpus siliculosus]|eukprot:CBJ27401.1 hypothetical protein Esi_0068_0057 [Ectocarpus siliculosus]
MQTIEREPPSLKSYPDDRQPGGDVFGRNFKEKIKKRNGWVRYVGDETVVCAEEMELSERTNRPSDIVNFSLRRNILR